MWGGGPRYSEKSNPCPEQHTQGRGMGVAAAPAVHRGGGLQTLVVEPNAPRRPEGELRRKSRRKIQKTMFP